jgi:predicted dinucleotide-binding enzyme
LEAKMHIVVVGAGNVGLFYARKWLATGHTVTLTYSRDDTALAHRAEEIGAQSAPMAEAIASADAVLLSVPFERVEDAVAQGGEWGDKLVIDTTNPFNPDRSGVVELPEGETSFSRIAALLPGVTLVKAFHNLGVAQVEDPEAAPVIFVVGTDAGARTTVSGLVSDADLVPVESGDLAAVALTEAPGRLFTALLDADQARSALDAPQ